MSKIPYIRVGTTYYKIIEKPESENRKSPESRTTKGKTKPETTEKTRRPDQILYRIALYRIFEKGID